jgi:mono/diheme cytochrome c family protein
MSRIQIEITLGIFFVLATSVILLIYGLNEEDRMAEFELAQQAHAIEVGAALFEQQCSRCHGTQGTGIPNLCPPLNDRNFFDNRLQEIGWSGTLEDYIIATASSGRLVSSRPQQYPGSGTPAMPAFSERFGGPLRDDQIRSIAAFIMNWEETAEFVEAPPTVEGPVAGEDITKELPEGDAANGEALATSQGCTACHISTPTGPAWLASGGEPGIGTRAAQRIESPGYTGSATTPEQYLFESIVLPDVHIVEGFSAGLMPQTYGETLTEQDVADLIAYLMSLE